MTDPSPAPPRARDSRRALQRLVNRIGPPRAPDFFGIGAEKCGTTWLWEMFRDHPEIGVSLPKELRYFSALYLGTGLGNFTALEQLLGGEDRPGHGSPSGLQRLATELRIAFGGDDAYLRIFGALDAAVVGDITPQYCMLPPEGLAHMQRLAPEARIILLMRDPVSRAISAGKMKAAEKTADKSAGLTDAQIRDHALLPFQLEMSRYSKMLPRFEEAFPGRVFVGFMDDIAARPLALLADLCAFLGVGFAPGHFTRTAKVANAGAQHAVGPELRRELYTLLAEEYDALEPRFPARVAGWRALHAEP